MSSDAVKDMLRKRGLLVADAWDDEEEEQDSPPNESSSKQISSDVAMNKQSGLISESASGPEGEEVKDHPRELDNEVRTADEPQVQEDLLTAGKRKEGDQVGRQQSTQNQEEDVKPKSAESDSVKDLLRKRGLLVEDAWDDEDVNASQGPNVPQQSIEQVDQVSAVQGNQVERVEPNAAESDRPKSAQSDSVKDLLRKRGLLVEEAWDDEDVKESQDTRVPQQSNEQVQTDPAKVDEASTAQVENQADSVEPNVAQSDRPKSAQSDSVKDLLRKRGLLVEEAWDDEGANESVAQNGQDRSVTDENTVVATREAPTLPEHQQSKQSSSVEGDWEESPRGDWEKSPRCLKSEIETKQIQHQPSDERLKRKIETAKIQHQPSEEQVEGDWEESPRGDWEESPRSLQGKTGVVEEKGAHQERANQNQIPEVHQKGSEALQDGADRTCDQPSTGELKVLAEESPTRIAPGDEQEGRSDPVSRYTRMLRGDLDAFDNFPDVEKARLRNAFSGQAVDKAIKADPQKEKNEGQAESIFQQVKNVFRKATGSDPPKGKNEVQAESILEHMREKGNVPTTSERGEDFDDTPLFISPSERNYDESEFEEFANEVARQACDERQIGSGGTMNSSGTFLNTTNEANEEPMKPQGTLKLSSSDGMRSLPGKPVAPRTLCRSYGKLPTAEDSGVLKRPIFLNTLSHVRSLPKIKFGEKRPSSFIRTNENPGPGSYNLGDPGRTSKFREHTTPSFGGGANRFDKEDPPWKVKPAPGQYGIPKNPVQEMQRKVAFSMDARECKRHNYVVKDVEPGPGSYELPSRFGKGIGVTAKGKMPKIYNAAKAFPGPGAYDPKHDGLSKFSATEKIGMGTSTRTNWAELHCCRTPGPGAYNNETYGELGRSSTKYSFKVRHRKPHSFDPYVTPGPGSYNAHGTCFGY